MKDPTSYQVRDEISDKRSLCYERTDSRSGALWNVRLAVRYVMKGPTSGRVDEQ